VPFSSVICHYNSYIVRRQRTLDFTAIIVGQLMECVKRGLSSLGAQFGEVVTNWETCCWLRILSSETASGRGDYTIL